jgi:hypothetical protein
MREFMDPEAQRRGVTSRVLRTGAGVVETDDDQSTPAERIAAVWAITLQCLQWGTEQSGEPRLQRSVGRVQRPRR